MENHGILNWRKWSVVRKAAIIGGFTGAAVTLVVHLLRSLFRSHMYLNILDWVSMALCYPAALLCYALGWEFELYSGDKGWSIPAFALMVLTNFLLSLFTGAAIGWFLSTKKEANTRF